MRWRLSTSKFRTRRKLAKKSNRLTPSILTKPSSRARSTGSSQMKMRPPEVLPKSSCRRLR